MLINRRVPQGTLLGGIEYLEQSNDNADCVKPEDKYKYVDDFHIRVASDITIDQKFLPQNTFYTQGLL